MRATDVMTTDVAVAAPSRNRSRACVRPLKAPLPLSSHSPAPLAPDFDKGTKMERGRRQAYGT
jgi:hypothetical protein